MSWSPLYTQWNDGPGGGTPIDAAAMNNLVAGIQYAISLATGGTLNLPGMAGVGVWLSVTESGSVYPVRPSYTGPVVWIGADAPASGGTTAGGTAKAVAGLDIWLHTP